MTGLESNLLLSLLPVRPQSVLRGIQHSFNEFAIQLEFDFAHLH